MEKGNRKKTRPNRHSQTYQAVGERLLPYNWMIQYQRRPFQFLQKKKPNIGLFELSKNETEKTINVVAVHGLQGDACKTWEHDNGFLWLRDFLPADIPDARIMTFGYDSTVAFSKSVANIEDKALELLNHLSAKRSPAAGGPSKPIFFISHSLGGIVVKKALILAHERDSNLDYKDILHNTRAIAFLGVPHRGSDSAWWAGFAANLLKNASLGTSTNIALLAGLEKGSSLHHPCDDLSTIC